MSEDPFKKQPSPSAAGMLLGLSAQMVTTTFAGTFLGWLADRGLGTEPYLLILGVLLGGAGGILGIWKAWNRQTH